MTELTALRWVEDLERTPHPRGRVYVDLRRELGFWTATVLLVDRAGHLGDPIHASSEHARLVDALVELRARVEAASGASPKRAG